MSWSVPTSTWFLKKNKQKKKDAGRKNKTHSLVASAGALN